MESERFDRLTRQFAWQGSRRLVLRGAAAGLAAMAAGVAGRRHAEATANSVPLGGVCYRDRQCYNYASEIPYFTNDQIVWCQDNGFGWDGEYNCCRYEGGYCWSNEHCCRDLICDGGFCGGVFYG